MARFAVLALLVALLLAGVCCGMDLVPRGPTEILKTEGGCIKQWEPDSALGHYAAAGAVEVTLEPQGVLLPRYMNTPSLLYVVEGSAMARLVTSLGPSNLHRLHQGDVVAVPEGFVLGVHNDGQDKFRALGVADLSNTRGKGAMNASIFFLFGNREDETLAPVINGFSKDVLAAAWNVDEATVEKLLTSQKGAGIIKVEKKESARAPAEPEPNTFFGDFSFNLEHTQAEVVTRGGSLNFVTKFKLPILETIGLSAAHTKLKPDALFAPTWSANAHHIVYFTRGKGRIQVAGPGGKTVLDRAVGEGDLVVIPKHFPAAKLAARAAPLEWVDVMTSPAPLSFFLAGANSVYKAFPFDVLVAGFNVDPEVEKKVLHARAHEAMILTRPKKSSVLSAADVEKAASDFFDHAVKGFFDM
ncbi:RmlC-like cupins superfamily protein [Klebsormidium nitens]|uniref:RmlC-like cupins superfamily protein n=1 Tax=Klebsormidium nitens TaxID=105231 RepID=A0A1Y1IR58_KLENI|nr:RmlC-like cupins superfamily protein [Klebsormidium nitens]|eukprot:GAQ91246.1 RmlC-like cupins superfamily protein [Klebsormidium nitens]